jgi:hypothetical protein
MISPQARILVFLAQITVAYRQGLYLGSHETPEGILRGADHRFSTHIETGIDDYRAACTLLERLQ